MRDLRFHPDNPYNPNAIPDPDDPTVPCLPAYLLNRSAGRNARREGLVWAVLRQFNRLSRGVRVVCVGCALLLAFCLLSPYINTALGDTVAQQISATPGVTPNSTAAKSPTTPPSSPNQRRGTGVSVPSTPVSSTTPRPTPPPAASPLNLTIRCAALDRSSGTGTLCVSASPGAQITAILTSCPSGSGEHATTTSMRVSGTTDTAGNYTWMGQLVNPSTKCHGDATAVVTVSRGGESVSEQVTFVRKHE